MGDREKREYVREMFTSDSASIRLFESFAQLEYRQVLASCSGGCSGMGGPGPLARSWIFVREQWTLPTNWPPDPILRGTVIGADFVVPMLKLGRKKMPLPAVGADALSTPFADEMFDGCTVGFGVRNLTDLEAGIAEMHRLLRPGARMVILEFCTPQFLPMRVAYLSYFKVVLPLIGRLVSKHDSAYSYLPESVLNFPSPDQLSEKIRIHGFENVGYRRLAMGIAAVHWGTRL